MSACHVKRSALASAMALLSLTVTARDLFPQEKLAVVQSLADEFSKHYVFEDKGEQLRKHFLSDGYKEKLNAITTTEQLAEHLSAELLAQLSDRHARVLYSDAVLPTDTEARSPAEQLLAERPMAEYINFGIENVQRLPGNIGYLQLNAFINVDLAQSALASAMSLLTHTDALIIDLRKNGGGDPATVTALASYFFAEKTHLNDIYWRADNSTESFYTTYPVEGDSYGQQKPVYILTSSRTASAGEGFSYELQQLKRATIIGEATRGAANPGGSVRLTDHFSAFIPTGRVINPISKQNWEGRGVQPDIVIPAAQALVAAQLAALKQLHKQQTNTRRAALIQQRIEELSQTQ